MSSLKNTVAVVYSVLLKRSFVMTILITFRFSLYNTAMQRRNILQLVFRRILMSVGVIFGASLITFFLSHMLPSDPARLIAGPRAGPEILAKIRIEYGLNRPLLHQYIDYLGRVFRLDFGQSLSSRRPVLVDLIDYLPATVELTCFALIFASATGVYIGVISALRENSFLNWVTRTLVYTSQSIPGYWLAVLAQLFFYYHLGWLPFGGRLSNEGGLPQKITGLLVIDSLLFRNFYIFGDALLHLILPALVLGFGSLAVIARITRASVLSVKGEMYVIAAKAKGLRRSLVMSKHILRPALLPIITSIGLEFGYTLGGALIIERIFAWPGIGRYTANAIAAADYNAIMGVTFICVIAFLIINGITDLIGYWLYPPIRGKASTH
jgi:peptide/nickel transport system permease protein